MEYFKKFGQPIKIVSEYDEAYQTDEWRDFAREIGFSSQTVPINEKYEPLDKIIREISKIIKICKYTTHEKWENIIGRAEIIINEIMSENRSIKAIESKNSTLDDKLCERNVKTTNKDKIIERINASKDENSAGVRYKNSEIDIVNLTNNSGARNSYTKYRYDR